MDQAPSTTNPYNDLPIVRLLDQQGGGLGLISQRDAARLLRLGQADLVLAVPPAVRLAIPTAEYQALDPAEPRVETNRLQFQHARQGALYGNVHFQNPHGQTMFHGDSEKALWYLNRGLVAVISTDPPVLRFEFEPGGSGHAGDEYYLASKCNRCVVCGTREGLNRHHVVPRVYRRHLPAEWKDHSHHDVLLLCLACHEKYEEQANRLKASLGEEFGVPLHGLYGERDRERSRASKLAYALVRYGERIPTARRDEMLQIIATWLGRWPVSAADLEAIARLTTTSEGRIEHGQHVIAHTDDVQEFIRRWRGHFLRTMQPRFLPDHWDVDRPAGRSSSGDSEG